MTTDYPPPDEFDYGDRLDDGQFENHPTIDEGEFVQAVRHRYVHDDCGGKTKMSDELAASVARDPTAYSKAFCATCGDYFPTSEFEWAGDGKPWVVSD